MKQLKNGQSGIAMIMALILLAVSSLIVVPILNLAATSLTYNRVVQRNTLETYAADAGVEYAQCEIGNDPILYEAEVLHASFTQNDREVDVTAEYVENSRYKITSIATTDGGSSTTIESYVAVSEYPGYFANGITSKGDVTIQPGSDIYADVQYERTLDNKGTIHGTAYKRKVTGWPKADDLNNFYWVESPVISGSSINITGGTVESPYLIGPVRATGDLNFRGSGIAKLEGNLFVEGNVTFMPNTGIMLNGKTIYCTGTFETDFTTFPNTGIYGPGCIIAVSDINFQPDIRSAEGGYILIMSVTGSVNFQPNNAFYGAIAAYTEANVQPNGGLYPEEPPSDLEFPDINALTTESYTIN